MIRNLENFLSLYVQFSFVRNSVYSVYIIVKKKLAVVSATRVVYTINCVYLVYVCIVIPTDCIQLCKYTRDINKNIHRQRLIRGINLIIKGMLLDKILLLIVDLM